MVAVSTSINWSTVPGDPVLQHELYLKYAGTTFSGIDIFTVKADIMKATASNESTSIIAYLCWLLRVIALVTS